MISKKLINLIYDMKYFLGEDNESIYYGIKQEIKFNPKYKGIRFMSEQRFYECLDIGEIYYDRTDFENIARKYEKFIDLYRAVKLRKKIFEFHCNDRFYDIIQSDELMTQGQSFDLIKILALYQKRDLYA
ncbi:MAG: hypothetical protein ACRC0X_04320 [Brevinema sp.]